MLRLFFLILLGLHGLIHLLGFIQAFGWWQLPALRLVISRPTGLGWLMAALLLGFTAGLYALRHPWWWLAGIVAAGFSQALIFGVWSEARWGSLFNLLLLLVALGGLSTYRFGRMVAEDRQGLEASTAAAADLLQPRAIDSLPLPVQRWLAVSGALDQPLPRLVYCEQSAQMKLQPGQSAWQPAQARQVVSLDPPGFVWDVRLDMGPGLPVLGRDRYQHGRGEMLIKLLGLVPVVNSRGNPRIDEGSLQRYLGEIVWYPQAAALPYLTWEPRDERSALATMSWGGISGQGTFFFDESGHFSRFEALRYRGDSPEAARAPWVIEVLERQAVAGLIIPVHMQATWKLPEGDWTWLDLRITGVSYVTPAAR